MLSQKLVRLRTDGGYAAKQLISSLIKFDQSTIFGIYTPNFLIQTREGWAIKFNLCTFFTSPLMIKNYYSLTQSEINYRGVVVSDSIKHYVDLDFIEEVEKIYLIYAQADNLDQIITRLDKEIEAELTAIFNLTGQLKDLFAKTNEAEPIADVEGSESTEFIFIQNPHGLLETPFDAITQGGGEEQVGEENNQKAHLPDLKVKYIYMNLKKKVDLAIGHVSRLITEKQTAIQFFKILAFLRNPRNGGFTLSHKVDFRGRVYSSSPLSVINSKFLRYVYTYGAYTDKELEEINIGIRDTTAYKLLAPLLPYANEVLSNPNPTIVTQTTVIWLLIELGKIKKSELLHGATITLKQFVNRGLEEVRRGLQPYTNKT